MHAHDDDAWWTELEQEIIDCLEASRAATPGEIGARLGMSERAAVSLLSRLAVEGKLRIALVEVNP
jgi:hypothetical protein